MKKILVIEDWDTLRKKLLIACKFHRHPYATEADIENLLLTHELKDVIKFETVVKVAVTSEKKELHQLISLPPDKTGDLKYGDTVQVYLVKQKKKEEPDDPK